MSNVCLSGLKMAQKEGQKVRFLVFFSLVTLVALQWTAGQVEAQSDADIPESQQQAVMELLKKAMSETRLDPLEIIQRGLDKAREDERMRSSTPALTPSRGSANRANEVPEEPMADEASTPEQAGPEAEFSTQPNASVQPEPSVPALTPTENPAVNPADSTDREPENLTPGSQEASQASSVGSTMGPNDANDSADSASHHSTHLSVPDDAAPANTLTTPNLPEPESAPSTSPTAVPADPTTSPSAAPEPSAPLSSPPPSSPSPPSTHVEITKIEDYNPTPESLADTASSEGDVADTVSPRQGESLVDRVEESVQEPSSVSTFEHQASPATSVHTFTHIESDPAPSVVPTRTNEKPYSRTTSTTSATTSSTTNSDRNRSTLLPDDEDFEDVYIDNSDPNNPKKVHEKRKSKSRVDANGVRHESHQSRSSTTLGNNPNHYKRHSSRSSFMSSSSGNFPTNWSFGHMPMMHHIPAIPTIPPIPPMAPMMPFGMSMAGTWPGFYGEQEMPIEEGDPFDQGGVSTGAYASAYAGFQPNFFGYTNSGFPMSRKQAKKLKRKQERAARRARELGF